MIDFLIEQYLTACDQDAHESMDYWMNQINELIEEQKSKLPKEMGGYL